MSEEQEPAAIRGFTQMSLSALKEIVSQGGGHRELAAYVVLCSGVDGRRSGRYCTHGAKSVDQRTAMGYRAAEKSIAWLHEHGFIRPPTEDEPKFLGKQASRGLTVRWVLRDGKDLDVAVSRQFIDGVKGHSTESPLKKMLGEISGNGEDITTGQAIADALLLYAALMKEQDFAACAGVDPDAWHQKFEPDEEEGHVSQVPDSNGVLVTVKESEHRFSTWKFMENALGEKPADEEQREQLRKRFWLALDHLRSLNLVYRVMVLWHGNPLDAKQRRKAEPIATQYINDSWARKIDPHLQYEVNRAAWRTGARDRYSDFTEAMETGSIPFVGSGSYRYIVKAGTEKNTHLVGQLRVRYWPGNESTAKGRAIEKQRTEKFSDAVSRLGRTR